MVERTTYAGATARPARAVEWELCRELVEKIGFDPGLYSLLTREDPEHRPDYIRVADLGGRPVAIALVVPRRVLLAGVWVEGAILALVGTDPAHRGKGLARLLVDDTVAYLRATGFRLGMLYGLREFFRRFGFVSCQGSYVTVIDPSRVIPWPASPATGPGGGNGADGRSVRFWRPAGERDAETLTRLFERVTAKTPCTVLRPSEPWVWGNRGPGGGGTVVCQDADSNGGISAYVRWSDRMDGLPPGAIGVPEVGATSTAALSSALEWVAARAHESGAKEVHFFGPPDHPFARLAYLRSRAETVIHPAKSGQVIITNRGLLMADLAGALSDRAVAASIPSGTTVILDVGSKRIELTITGGQLRFLGGRAGRQTEGAVSRLSVEAFTALLTGYAGGGEVGAFSGVSLAEEHVSALAALFPRAYPKWIPAPYW